MSVDDREVQNFKNALVNRFEALSNKKNDITGDFTQDNSSYATVQAIKSFISNLFSGLHAVATSGDYDDLENTPVFDFVKQATAEAGYASSYYLTINGTQVGAKLNVEKDKMVRSGSVETVGATPTAEETAAGLVTGDQYILLVVQTVDNDGTTNLIIPTGDWLQTADETTITVSASGVFSIKAGGVTSTELASNSVTTAKIVDGNVTTAKIDAKAVTKAKLADEVSAQWTADANSEIESVLIAVTNALNED